MPGLLGQFRPERRYIETELAQSFHESDAILLVDRDPDIEIAGGARIAVVPTAYPPTSRYSILAERSNRKNSLKSGASRIVAIDH
ncbi:MAG: hypothetical protein M3505_04900, partial [Verrucomicrobiota bacterium]|nr:hypothetical protein [Verrucomicrobiota bacterium]